MKDIKEGTELLIDGGRLVVVVGFTDGGLWVSDEDGFDFEITEARITNIY
jgi:hypothetical protein